MHHIYTFFSSLYVNNKNHCCADVFFVSARVGCCDLCLWHMFPMPTKGFDLACCAAAQQFLSISHVRKERHHPHPPPTYPISSMDDHVCKNRSVASHVCKCKTRHYPHSPPSHLRSCMGHLLVSVGSEYTPTTPNNPCSAELRVAMTMPCSASRVKAHEIWVFRSNIEMQDVHFSFPLDIEILFFASIAALIVTMAAK